MNQLQEFFDKNQKNAIHKWTHYFDIYDFWFNKYRNREIVILEVGVYQGGSLKMWRDYFGKDAKIFGIDINPECKQFEDENTEIFIGSQEDRNFWKEIRDRIPKIDILIDDGGHTMQQQKVTFEEMYFHVKDNGLYLCEDLHTSYWPVYGGGYRNTESFIEYSKDFIDYINAWHSKDARLQVGNFTRSTYSLHYYDSILVIEKKPVAHPKSELKGEVLISLENFPPPKQRKSLKKGTWQSFKIKIKNFLKK